MGDEWCSACEVAAFSAGLHPSGEVVGAANSGAAIATLAWYYLRGR